MSACVCVMSPREKCFYAVLVLLRPPLQERSNSSCWCEGCNIGSFAVRQFRCRSQSLKSTHAEPVLALSVTDSVVAVWKHFQQAESRRGCFAKTAQTSFRVRSSPTRWPCAASSPSWPLCATPSKIAKGCLKTSYALCSVLVKEGN